jgi:sulfite exporter TauE/SafE
MDKQPISINFNKSPQISLKMEFYIAALIFGFITSFHCMGMCGPIAIAIPLHKDNWLLKISGGLLYNSGRIITYGILGALFGLLGRGIQLAGLQQ